MCEIAAFDAEAVRRASLRADKMVAPLIAALEAGVREAKLSFKQVLLRAVELAAAILGFPEAAIYGFDALAARMLEALMREDAPQLETVADVEALHRQGERRALAALVRALQARGSLPAECFCRAASTLPLRELSQPSRFPPLLITR